MLAYISACTSFSVYIWSITDFDFRKSPWHSSKVASNIPFNIIPFLCIGQIIASVHDYGILSFFHTCTTSLCICSCNSSPQMCTVSFPRLLLFLRLCMKVLTSYKPELYSALFHILRHPHQYQFNSSWKYSAYLSSVSFSLLISLLLWPSSIFVTSLLLYSQFFSLQCLGILFSALYNSFVCFPFQYFQSCMVVLNNEWVKT